MWYAIVAKWVEGKKLFAVYGVINGKVEEYLFYAYFRDASLAKDYITDVLDGNILNS